MWQSLLSPISSLAGKWMDWRTDRALRNMPEMEFELKSFEEVRDEQGWSMQMVANMQGIAMFADMVADILDAHDAENYVQFEVLPRLDRGLRPILVTLQWARGLSPSQKAVKLEKRVDELEVMLSQQG